jgi:DNA-binding NarL/FixJ family response regulator
MLKKRGPTRRQQRLRHPFREKQKTMIRVLILARSVLGAGIRSALEQRTDWQIQCAAQDPAEVAELARRFQPQVTILDDTSHGALALFEALGRDGVGALGMKMVVTAAYQCEETLFQFAKWGAAAYLSDTLPLADFLSAVQRVSAGEWLLTEQLRVAPPNAHLAPRPQPQLREQPAVMAEALPSALTTREAEVLTCIAQGMYSKEIARDLKIGRQAIRNHLASCYRKLGVSDRTAAVVVALRRGWIAFPTRPISPEAPYASVA